MTVENPKDDLSKFIPKLTLEYTKKNDGTSRTNPATLGNKFKVGFPGARVRFVMAKGSSYTIFKGNIEQTFEGDSVCVVDVRVAIEAGSTTSIEIKLGQ